MNRKQKFVSLNLKMAIAIVLGLFLAVCTYVFCSWVTEYVAEVMYESEAAVAQNVGKAYDDFEDYIRRNDLKATDTKALKHWVEDQTYTYLYIYDNNSVILDAGWAVNSSSESPDEDLSEEESLILDTESETHGVDKESFTEDVQNRIIKFTDGEYYVYIDVYQQQRWREIMGVVSMVLSFFVLLMSVLLYHGHVLRRITALSQNVQQISDGDLDHGITDAHQDEIGNLAESVDNMRNSIIQKHRNEKEAWEANNQLITSMSHDIRTPLTSMIGYLDIIEGKKYDSQEALDKYISSCREKAFQLKDLSDKLFQYFLVFGNKEIDKNLEYMDASILFQQLLAEHSAEIISYGYKAEFYYNIPEVSVLIDISGLQRLFDNVFSNIMKYADKKENVCIYAETEDEKSVKILVINGIPEASKKVESTRIGLKTCEKICSDLGGEFSYDEQERIFTVRILLPIVQESQEASEDRGEDKAEGGLAADPEH